MLTDYKRIYKYNLYNIFAIELIKGIKKYKSYTLSIKFETPLFLPFTIKYITWIRIR